MQEQENEENQAKENEDEETEEREEAEEKEWDDLHAEVAQEAQKDERSAQQDEEVEEVSEDIDAGSNSAFNEYKAMCMSNGTHTYSTNVLEGTCACVDRVAGGNICKHLFRGLVEINKTLTALPEGLLNAPHLCLDLHSLKGNLYAMQGVSVCSDDTYTPMEWDTDVGAEEPAAHTTRAPSPTTSTEQTPKSTAGSCPVVEAEQLGFYTSSVARLKQLTALVHGNRLSNDMREKLSNIFEDAFNQAADDEKQHINQTDNFTQKGINHRQTHNDTRVRKAEGKRPHDESNTSEVDEANFEKNNGKGRRAKKKQNISHGMDGPISWEEVSNAEVLEDLM